MLKKKAVVSTLLAVIVVFTFVLTACSSLERGARQGARDGVSQGIAGLFNIGGGSSGSSGDSSGETSSSPQRNYSGSTQTVPWPSDTSWKRYGLEGLQQPPETNVTGAALYMGMYIVSLINGGRPAFDNLVAQIEGRPGTRLVTEVMDSDSIMMGFSLQTGNTINLIVNLVDGDIAIQAYPAN
jgi:hypothetical protein